MKSLIIPRVNQIPVESVPKTKCDKNEDLTFSLHLQSDGLGSWKVARPSKVIPTLDLRFEHTLDPFWAHSSILERYRRA